MHSGTSASDSCPGTSHRQDSLTSRSSSILRLPSRLQADLAVMLSTAATAIIGGASVFGHRPTVDSQHSFVATSSQCLDFEDRNAVAGAHRDSPAQAASTHRPIDSSSGQSGASDKHTTRRSRQRQRRRFIAAARSGPVAEGRNSAAAESPSRQLQRGAASYSRPKAASGRAASTPREAVPSADAKRSAGYVAGAKPGASLKAYTQAGAAGAAKRGSSSGPAPGRQREQSSEAAAAVGWQPGVYTAPSKGTRKQAATGKLDELGPEGFDGDDEVCLLLFG